ncbi:MAG: Hsp70 family protein [Proteobacteria bacterium]|nr:Hsp70 family protein [Pseudomonadota bacterium]
MLLQLLEPGQSTNETTSPHKVAVGIDLGTTHSLVAMVKDGKPVTLTLNHGHVLMPSAVYTQDGHVLTGHEALEKGAQNPAALLTSFKRFMGDTKHPEENKDALYASAKILACLKRRAEEALGHGVSRAVITVPAYFSEAARSATRQAAQLAGIDVLRLVSEPTAAALAYGLEKSAQGLYLVYDLGGGTFDVSLLRLEGEVFQVIGTAGDTNLGGDTFDALLAAHLEAGFGEMDEAHQKSCMRRVRTLRETLSNETRVSYGDKTLTRDQFEALIAHHVNHTLALVERVLSEAHVEANALQGIILVGGATRTPLIRKSLEARSQAPVLGDMDPDHVVAWGAALQAHALSSGSGPLLMDVLALSLGLETMGGGVEVLLPRNSPLPISKTQSFTTFQDGQAAILIHVVQGEAQNTKDCRTLTRFEVSGLPPVPAGMVRLQVRFTMDVDGLLTITAKEKSQELFQEVSLKPTHGLSLDDMVALLARNG